jgi:hypothetical protein
MSILFRGGGDLFYYEFAVRSINFSIRNIGRLPCRLAKVG